MDMLIKVIPHLNKIGQCMLKLFCRVYSSTAPSKTNELKLALKLRDDDGDGDGDSDDEMFNNGMKPLLKMHAFNHSNLHFTV